MNGGGKYRKEKGTLTLTSFLSKMFVIASSYVFEIHFDKTVRKDLNFIAQC